MLVRNSGLEDTGAYTLTASSAPGCSAGPGSSGIGSASRTRRSRVRRPGPGDGSASRSASVRRPRGAARRLASFACRAPVLVATVVAVLAGPAQAQTVTLVSNEEETVTGSNSNVRAQRFRTGDDSSYLISEIDIRSAPGESAVTTDTHVTLWTDDADEPGTQLDVELKAPAAFQTGFNRFTVPSESGLRLGRRKTYFVVVNHGISTTGDRLVVDTTTNDSDQGASGWWMGNGSLWADAPYSPSWGDSSASVMMRVRGEGTPANADAYLSDLTVSGTDLYPGFAPGRFDYAGSVPNATTRVTFTRTKFASGATVAYEDGDGNPLDDLDGMEDGHQVDLAEGENVVRLVVTSGNSNNELTYTVRLARVVPVATRFIPVDWSLKPNAVAAGESFRLLFAAPARLADSGDIAEYNAWVQQAAAIGHAEIGPFSSDFRVLGSTGIMNMHDNTGTGPTDADAPIYWVHESATREAVADGYADFYDGSWGNDAVRSSGGVRIPTSPLEVYTGSHYSGLTRLPLGSSSSNYVVWAISNNGSGTVRDAAAIDPRARRVLGLSPLFRVWDAATVPTLSDLSVSVGALGPAFSARTLDYVVNVPAGTERITVAATPTLAGSAVVFEDDRFNELDDLDGMENGHQLDLEPGENLFRLIVSATNSSAPLSYTLRVRAICTEGAVWCTDLTVGGDPEDVAGYCNGAGTTVCGYGSVGVAGVTLYGQDYVVESVRWDEEDNSVHLTLDRDFPDDRLDLLTLWLGEDELALGDALRNLDGGLLANNYRWDNARTTAIAALEADETVLVQLTREPLSEDATLSGLSLTDSAGAAIGLAPGFGPNVFDYAATVAGPNDRVTFMPAATEAFATVAYTDGDGTALDDADGDGNNGHQVDLAEGANVVRVVVTADDRITTLTYTVTVQRPAAVEDATLSALALTDGGGAAVALAPGFGPGFFDYAATVPNPTARITIAPTAANAGATVAYEDGNGATLADADGDANGHQVDLAEGTNVVRVVVTADDRITTLTYTVTVQRPAASEDATLSRLSLTDGGGAPVALAPVFASGVFDYAATVAGTTTWVTIAPMATNAGATVAYTDGDGTALDDADGDANNGHQVNLAEGANVVRVVVTADDGVTRLTYTVTVQRPAPMEDATLSGLSLKEGGGAPIPLAPAFGPGFFDYAATVSSATMRVTFVPTSTDAAATVAYTDGGGAVLADTDGDANNGHQVDLVEGENVVRVVVTADDGTTMLTYTVTVQRPAPLKDATLSALSLTDGEDATVALDPDFASGVFDYAASVPNATTRVTITPTPTNAGATVAYTDGNGTTLDDADGLVNGQQVDLDVGPNVVRVVVTAADANTTLTYTVTVERLASTRIPANWSLKPAAVGVGKSFRLLFLSSTKRVLDATDIADYDAFVQRLAAGGHADIQAFSSQFRVVGSTAAVDARDHTATRFTEGDRGLPIYWLNGARVANHYEDFYDQDWDDEANPKDESGANGPDTSLAGNYPATGSRHNGTEKTSGGESRALGADRVAVAKPYSTFSTDGPLSSSTDVANARQRPLYGLSPVLTVVSSDATLSALALTDGGGATVALDPVFASDVVAYAATVPHATTRVTITPTPTIADATVAYTDGNDAALADADGDAANGQQADLAAGSNVVKVVVTAADDATTMTYTVTVTRAAAVVNTPPEFEEDASTSRSVAENTVSGQPVGAPVTATDADSGDTLTYSKTGADAAKFGLTASTGQLLTETVLDHEDPVDANEDGVYELTLSVSDGNGGMDSIDVTVTVTDVVETSMVTVTGLSDASTAENAPWTSPAPTVTGAIGDVTWSKSGADAARFTLAADGKVTLPAQDYESAADADMGNDYEVTVEATDSDGNEGEQSITVTVTDVVETSMVTVTGLSDAMTEENEPWTSPAPTVTGAIGDVTWSKSGADAARFTLAADGKVTLPAQSYESAVDANGDNEYEVTVEATDEDDNDGEQSITVAVTDVDEKPDRPAAPTVEATPNATDSLDVSWTAPGLNGGPEITGYKLRHQATSEPWSETTLSGTGTTATIDGLEEDTSYSVQVRALTGELDSDWSPSGTGSTSANSAPAFGEGAGTSRSVAENTASGQNVGTPVTATDADTGDTLTYSLEGADANSFGIDASTGQILTSAALDRETTPSYEVTVKADDGNGGTATIAVMVNVTNVVEPPSAPDAPTVRTESATSLSVSWREPDNTGPRALTYDLQYRASGGSWTDGPQDLTDRRAVIGSLIEGTDYDVQVRAENAEGMSGWSASGSGRPRKTETPVLTVEAHGTGRGGLARFEVWRRTGAVSTRVRYARVDVDDREVGVESRGVLPPGVRREIVFLRLNSRGRASVQLLNPVAPYCGTPGAARDCTDEYEVGSPSSATVDVRASSSVPVDAFVSGGRLTLRYAEGLDAASTPGPKDWVVAAATATGVRTLAVTGVSVSGADAVLALSPAAEVGEAVTLDYLPWAMHPLLDSDGVEAAPLTDLAVRNETLRPQAGGEDAPPGRPVDELGGDEPPLPSGQALLAALLAENPASSPTRLELRSLNVTDISALAGLAGLETLDLSDNAVANLWPLAELAALRRLDLSGNRIADVSALAGLAALETLDLSGNAVSNAWPLSGLVNLKRLDLSGNPLGDVSALAGLAGLEVLVLDGGGVADVLPLALLPRLARLDLSGNALADVTLLAELRSLARLDLSGNRIAAVDALGDLSHLVWLDLSGNPVVDAAPLGRLTALRWLWLDPDANGIGALARHGPRGGVLLRVAPSARR